MPSNNLQGAADSIFTLLDTQEIIDPHTHIMPLQPASRHLNDLLGYHYYTELVHSSGIPRERIESVDLTPDQRVKQLVEGLSSLSNTVQLQWLHEIAADLFGFDEPELTPTNCGKLLELSANKMAAADWPDQVLRRCRVSAVMLTNDFDDPLDGFDTARYMPCLRTDELVFHLAKPTVRERLTQCSGIDIGSLEGLRQAIAQRFRHFLSRGARACAISLPPDFVPQKISDAAAQNAWDQTLKAGSNTVDQDAQRTLSQFVFWTLAERCEQHRLPFDLMIGVHRRVYPAGVYQGQDLYDSRVSLYEYRHLFNAFPSVYFPISVLASVTNQELVSYAWIFPNVIPFGHWWYSNTPSIIYRDLSHRMEAVPATKLIGYYSDAYKLEFILPKFRMYKRVLSRVLADQFVGERNWSEQKAVDLGIKILKSNSEIYFPARTGDSA